MERPIRMDEPTVVDSRVGHWSAVETGQPWHPQRHGQVSAALCWVREAGPRAAYCMFPLMWSCQKSEVNLGWKTNWKSDCLAGVGSETHWEGWWGHLREWWQSCVWLERGSVCPGVRSGWDSRTDDLCVSLNVNYTSNNEKEEKSSKQMSIFSYLYVCWSI